MSARACLRTADHLLEQEGRINGPLKSLPILFAVFLCLSRLFNQFLPKITELEKSFKS